MARCPHAFTWLRGRPPSAIAARWARLLQLSLALGVRRELARIRLLFAIDAATEHLDNEAGYYSFVVLLEPYVQHEWFYFPCRLPAS